MTHPPGLIRAGMLALTVLVSPFAAADPTPPVVLYGTGVAGEGNNIYKLTIPGTGAGTSEIFVALPSDPSTNDNSPNGIAFDKSRGLLYYSVNPGTANDQIYSVNVDDPTAAPVLRGTVVGRATGALMYENDYYYIGGGPGGTKDFYKVTLGPTGDVLSSTLRCSPTTSSRFQLGDLAGLQGVIYGSAKDTLNTSSTADDRFVFFQLKLDDCSLTSTPRPELSRQLQLAWGSDFKLYGYDPATRLISELDINTGAASTGPTYVPLVGMSDLDSLPPEAAVEIVKKTNDTDNNDPALTGPKVQVGNPVTWTYFVTNTGQLTLTDVTVTDDKLSDSEITCDDGVNADNIVASLAPDESVTCTASGQATLGGYVNIGTVDAGFEGPYGPDTIDASDPDRYLGIPAPLACPAGGFFTEMLPNGDLAIRYDQFPAPNDNSYGANAVGWPNGHKFSDYTGSDKAGIQIKDAGGTVRLSFNLDYLSAKTGTPSGFASLGPFGGDGKVLVGSLTPADLEWDTSLARNLNDLGYFSSGVQVQGLAVANLLLASPPTADKISDYTLTPAAETAFPAGWNFHNTYFAVLKAAKLSAIGFNPATWTVEPNPTALHNSPAKKCPPVPGQELLVVKREVKDKQVKITVQNDSATNNAVLTQLRATWPQAINGNLVQIKLDGDVLWSNTTGVGGGSTDALGNPVGVPPLVTDIAKRTITKGTSDVYTLVFKNNAAPLSNSAYGGLLWFGGDELAPFVAPPP
ncbi:MAG: hypothetical protein RL434_3044 [Pseudomonadota bacterium]